MSRGHGQRVPCFYCLCRIGGRAITDDHVIPRARGGPRRRWNMVPCCSRCNHRKADKTASEFGAEVAHRLGVQGFVFLNILTWEWNARDSISRVEEGRLQPCLK